ncbi:MAG: vancomycin resistance protein VanW [Myxococcota bacterium]|jgi:vancomycin resistance protein VanW
MKRDLSGHFLASEYALIDRWFPRAVQRFKLTANRNSMNQKAPIVGALAHAGIVSTAARRARVAGYQSARLISWAGGRFPAGTRDEGEHEFAFLQYEERVPLLRTDEDVNAELEAGKRHNVALAAPAFDGLVLNCAQPLSFWRTVGRISAAGGFVAGMELRGGCVVPAVGGGICLISNALFAAAVRCGWTILERHGHSLEAMPTEAGHVWGLDATVFWPHVDLVVAPESGQARLTVRVEGDELLIRVHSTEPLSEIVTVWSEAERVVQTPDGAVHEGRVIRRRADGANRRLREDVVATNRKRVVDPSKRRSCYDCDMDDCHTGRSARRAPRAWTDLV